MGKVHIYTKNSTLHKTIETNLSIDEVIVSGSMIPFFHSLTPRHTGSYVSGSVEYVDPSYHFEGESYSFEDF
jgi:hypothetical protein